MNKLTKITLGLTFTSVLLAFSHLGYANGVHNTGNTEVNTQNIDFAKLTDEQLLSLSDSDLSKLTAKQLKAYISAVKKAEVNNPSLKSQLDVKIQKAQAIQRTATQSRSQIARSYGNNNSTHEEQQTSSNNSYSHINTHNTTLSTHKKANLGSLSQSNSKNINSHDKLVQLFTKSYQPMLDMLNASGTTLAEYYDIYEQIDDLHDEEYMKKMRSAKQDSDEHLFPDPVTGDEITQAFKKEGINVDGNKLKTLEDGWSKIYAYDVDDIIDPLGDIIGSYAEGMLGSRISMKDSEYDGNILIDIDKVKDKITKAGSPTFSLKDYFSLVGIEDDEFLQNYIDKQLNGKTDFISLLEVYNKLVPLSQQQDKLDDDGVKFKEGFMLLLDNLDDQSLDLYLKEATASADSQEIDDSAPPFLAGEEDESDDDSQFFPVPFHKKSHVPYTVNPSSKHAKKKATSHKSTFHYYYQGQEPEKNSEKSHTTSHHNVNHSTYSHYKKSKSHNTSTKSKKTSYSQGFSSHHRKK